MIKNEPTEVYNEIYGFFDFDNIYSDMVNKFDNAIFVEVGCMLGKSTAFLANEIKKYHKNIQLYAVDIWQDEVWRPIVSGLHYNCPESQQYLEANKDRPVYDLFIENMINFGVINDINIIKKDSIDTSHQFDDNSLDFVYLDGSHEYEYLIKEIPSWFAKVKPGGYLGGHDWAMPSISDAVKYWFKEEEIRFYIPTVNYALSTPSWIVQKIENTKPKLNIITACSRPEALNFLYENIKEGKELFDLQWIIAIDTCQNITKSDINIVDDCITIHEISDSESRFGTSQRNAVLGLLSSGFVYFLDDDNLIHPNFFKILYNNIINNDKKAFVFPQILEGGGIRPAGYDRIGPDSIDQAQFVVDRSLIGDEKYVNAYQHDGIFIRNIYQQHPADFLLINEPLCYYNKLKWV